MFSLLTRAPSNTSTPTNSFLDSKSKTPVSTLKSTSTSVSSTAAHPKSASTLISTSNSALLSNLQSYALKTGKLLKYDLAPKHARTNLLVLVLHAILLFTLIFSTLNAEQSHLSRLLPEFACPVDDFLATGCEAPKDCLYKLEGRCGEFVECRWSKDISSSRHPARGSEFDERKGVNGDEEGNLRVEAVMMQCPVYFNSPNWQWNDIRKRCDHPGTKGTCSWAGEGEEDEDNWTQMEETPHLGLIIKWIVEEYVLSWPSRLVLRSI